MTVVHLAGPQLQFETQDRQRCSWCGALLIDRDTRRVAIAVDPSDPNPDLSLPWWEVGSFVACETPDGQGGVSWVVEPEASHHGGVKAPADSCLRMPHEATA